MFCLVSLLLSMLLILPADLDPDPGDPGEAVVSASQKAGWEDTSEPEDVVSASQKTGWEDTSDPGEDVVSASQKTGWEDTSDPQARRTSAGQHSIAATAGLALTHCFIESYDDPPCSR